MAKILGYNKIYKTQYKADCKNCGAIVLFDEKEIKDEYQYNQYEYSIGKCPSCGKNISVDKNKCKTQGELANAQYIKQELEWPNISNCIKDCVKCNAKCMHRRQDTDWTLFDEFGRLKIQ